MRQLLGTVALFVASTFALQIPSPLPTGWNYEGCITDSVGSRTLTGGYYGDGNTMTIESCIGYCSALNYIYAGIEYSAQCYCGDSLTSGYLTKADSECSMACSGNANEPCGNGDRLTLFMSNKSPPAPNPGVNNYGLIGCYTDSAARSLPIAPATLGGASNMSALNCINACSGYTYAAVEYGGECYCGNAFQNGGAPAVDGDAGCNMLCSGNAYEYCGGGYRMTTYQLGAPILLGSSSSSSVSSSKLSSSSVSSISGSSTISATSSHALSSISTSVSSVSPASSSSASVILVALGPGWYSIGCYTDSTAARTLANGIATIGGSANLTTENCQTACKAAGYTIAGTEYSGECFCDNIFQNGGGPAPDGNAQCTMTCNGNTNQICGGPNRLTTYQYSNGPPIVSSSQSSSSSTKQSSSLIVSTISSVSSGSSLSTSSQSSLSSHSSQSPTHSMSYSNSTTSSTISSSKSISSSVSSSSSSTFSSASATATGWTYKGCYTDNYNNLGRSLLYQQPEDNTMTPEKCVALCKTGGYKVAGLEYYTQCFCDSGLRNSAPNTTEADCNTPCGGNTSQLCGGPNRLSIYSDGSLPIYKPPVLPQTLEGGNWTYQGCLIDNVNQKRVLPHQLIIQNNTLEACLAMCGKYGYMVGGAEYGNECYCGTDGDYQAAGSSFAPDADCKVMACPGNASEYCAAGNRIAYYKWTAPTPLFVWNYPQGNDAGAYQFLIGGVVVPLMTTVGVNGKVTFQEKSGTGAPNTTGAYELDLAQLSNFTGAWREMHVETDIFCSAGITLPDKFGRQMTVGGWSAPSTYGIRLYTPDGSPGVNGKNDWIEHPGVVMLQNGRWYPTATIIANGSVLVVGGEEGSNGAPVPTLEILPNGGPPLLMPWLQRTDPMNLYPFILVLPSGGIFAGYFNEAIILDENTFAITRTLPGIPGAVGNDINSGRTYPLEGAMVTLPMHAPYTEPLTVLICGGSVNPTGEALDSCVSIQPEVQDAQWVLERMPSKRVMSCMAGLPDGTYLIVNGAHQGTAGFALAEDPNLNAILYDPTKPVGARMSIMANTTIARMYHSEAILLLDGRVLISGSDPIDTRYPEEYRVEVFVPPYILKGLARPTFTIVNKDWDYDAAVTISITSGSTANIKVSMLGAVSSTHGNAMGQSTLFPAVSCAGSTCTITTPTNSHIATPGWYMIFVLDGSTPSIGQYVRLGKDPAGFGNWPTDPKFAPLPGM